MLHPEHNINLITFLLKKTNKTDELLYLQSRIAVSFNLECINISFHAFCLFHWTALSLHIFVFLSVAYFYSKKAILFWQLFVCKVCEGSSLSLLQYYLLKQPFWFYNSLRHTSLWINCCSSHFILRKVGKEEKTYYDNSLAFILLEFVF